ncbi:hypothetical protein RUM43_000530 [Polyplax serrata]|uniref:Uncharacterized protein n=1 Tax=Polyplax serrata TaxID=468196 RepID=A0AAN8SCJ3_POLSC
MAGPAKVRLDKNDVVTRDDNDASAQTGELHVLVCANLAPPYQNLFNSLKQSEMSQASSSTLQLHELAADNEKTFLFY